MSGSEREGIYSDDSGEWQSGSEPDTEEKQQIIDQQQTASAVEALLVEDPPQEVMCPVCLTLALDPVIFTPCGHLFCRSCDLRISECPICRCNREGVSATALDINTNIQNLKVYCKRKDNGCKAIIEVKNIKGHEKKCKFGKEVCLYCGGRFVRIEWKKPMAHKEHCPVGRILNKELTTLERLEKVRNTNRVLKAELDRLSQDNMRWRTRCEISNELLSKERSEAVQEARNENIKSIEEALGIRSGDPGERKEIAGHIKPSQRIEAPEPNCLAQLDSRVV